MIDPQNKGTLYAATQGNGVFKTTNGGANWSQASADLPGPFVVTLVMNPQNTSTLYALMNYYGVYKSTDGGTSWYPVSSGLPGSFGVDLLELPTLVIDPQHPDTLYTAPSYSDTEDDGRGSELDCRELRATEPIGVFTITSLAIDPQNPNTVFALGGSSVFNTTDGGANWRVVGSAPPASDWATAILRVDPQNSSTLYAGTRGSGILKSTDAGATWAAANSGLPALSRTLGLALDPQSPSTIYALLVSGSAPLPSGKCCSHAGSLYKSIDGGANWFGSGSGLTRTDFDPRDACSCGATNLGLAVDPVSPGTVYVGTYWAGVFKSADNGAHWDASNAGLRAISGRLAIDPQDPRTLYLASWNRVFKTSDSGMNWSPGAWGLPDVGLTMLAVDPQTSGVAYAGSAETEDGPGGRIFKTVDGGTSWQDAGLDQPSSILVLAFDPLNPETVYAGTGVGLFRAAGGGGSWTATGPSAPAPLGVFSLPIYSIPIDRQNPSTIYVGVQIGGQASKIYKRGMAAQVGVRGVPGCPTAAVSACWRLPRRTRTRYMRDLSDTREMTLLAAYSRAPMEARTEPTERYFS